MYLMNELHDVKMTRDDIVASYFIRISHLRDQLQAIISDKELAATTLNVFPGSWNLFASNICGREKIPSF